MLSILAIILLALLLALFLLLIFSWIMARRITRRFPPQGNLVDVGGYRMHAVHVSRSDTADLPPLVFIHGASGNCLDQMTPFLAPLSGRAEILFVDRPGHGHSERGGPENDTPDGQARAIAALMDHYGIERAIICGHSFGGAIAASFALEAPQKTAGLLFLSPATHPWPGGVDWYYTLTAMPVLGWLFSRTLAVPAGLMRMQGAIRAVFHPNPQPSDYHERTAPALVLRPATFRNNAKDVAGLLDYVTTAARSYPSISAPTIVITGDSDDIVLADIHSVGLVRDIANAELVTIRDLGHKPDYIATDIAIAAIEKIAGRPHDLQHMARTFVAPLAAE